jgi:hypothetical protein
MTSSCESRATFNTFQLETIAPRTRETLFPNASPIPRLNEIALHVDYDQCARLLVEW